jgi:hypothetical protein
MGNESMLLLSPRVVTFGESVWQNVTLVAIDRETSRAALDYGDLGPHPTSRRCTGADDADQGHPGTRRRTTLALRVRARSGHGHALYLADRDESAAHEVERVACVESVTHEVSLKRGTHRTVTLLALSPDGAADPITTESSD